MSNLDPSEKGEADKVRYTNFERIMKYAPENTQTMVRDVDEHFFTPDFFAPQTDTVYCQKLMGFIASVHSR